MHSFMITVHLAHLASAAQVRGDEVSAQTTTRIDPRGCCLKWRPIGRGMQRPRSRTSPYILRLRVHLPAPCSPVTRVFPNTSHITYVRCDPDAKARTIPSPNFVRQIRRGP